MKWTLILTQFKLKILFLFFLPLLSKIKFRILTLKDHKIIVKLPLKRINTNHYKSLYFGAQTMVAEALPYLYIYLLFLRQTKHCHIVTQSFNCHFYQKANTPLFLSLKYSKSELKQMLNNINQQGHSQCLTFVIHGFCFKNNQAILTSSFTMDLHVKSRRTQ